jgi:SET domain-containing protein 6
MYESIRPSTSSGVNWAAYFALMPTLESFDTLMFWNEVQLKGLEGSSVLDKIGREEVEEEYTSNVLPFILAHPGVFGSVEGYGMERFHWCGSLVLSRSFHVESGEDESEDEEEEEEDEETEDVGDVAMVPMADLLNAMSGKDNVRTCIDEIEGILTGIEDRQDCSTLPSLCRCKQQRWSPPTLRSSTPTPLLPTRTSSDGTAMLTR